MTTPPEFIANMSEISQTAASKSTLASPLSLQYILSSMRFYDRWIQRGKIKRPQKLLWLFLPHLYLQNILSHVPPLLLCLVLQQSTLFAINNRTEEQKVINKAYMAKNDKTYFQRSQSPREMLGSRWDRQQSPVVGQEESMGCRF